MSRIMDHSVYSSKLSNVVTLIGMIDRSDFANWKRKVTTYLQSVDLLEVVLKPIGDSSASDRSVLM